MKTKRHAKILDIINTHKIYTQEQLQQQLLLQGFDVTQATVSRDIKELHLIKTLGSDGRYNYSFLDMTGGDISTKFDALFSDTVTNIDFAGNIVVVKCLPGTATAVCASLDALHMPDIVGTISGDDTFMCIMRNEQKSVDFVTKLKKIL